jgi:hypothetical protein
VADHRGKIGGQAIVRRMDHEVRGPGSRVAVVRERAGDAIEPLVEIGAGTRL